MRMITVIALSMMIVSCAWAQNLVTNSDFSTAVEGQMERPEGWRIPAAGWERIPDAGPDGGAVLRVTVPEGPPLPAVQNLDYARPGAEYTLTVAAWSDGTLRPVARVVNRDMGDEIVEVIAEAAEGWQELSASFETPTANLTVEIFVPARAEDDGRQLIGTGQFGSVTVTPVNQQGDRQRPELENVALGKPYETRPSNYALCAHPDDTTMHLTDGEYTEGYFWTQPTTVGWRSGGPEFITIDLEDVYPIAGVGYSTAAGVAGVEWPNHITVFVSPDGEEWYAAGDLVRLHTAREPLPPIGEYATRLIWTDELATKGRFVKLAVFTSGPYIFVDEVEVYRGPDELLAAEYTARPLTDVQDHVMSEPIFELHRRHLAAIREQIAQASAADRAGFIERADALEAEIATLDAIPMESFRPIVPITDLHKRIFALQAELWLAEGKDRVRLWQAHRWDPLLPAQEPAGGEEPRLSVEMMQNETRADVLNITSANPSAMRMQVQITGLPGGTSPDWITLRQVEHIGSRFVPTVASPLPEADRVGDGWNVEVPAGMTRQLWFEIDSTDLEPGTWEGAIELRSAAAGTQSVPLTITVHPLTMPEEKTLYVGGWDYTDSDSHRALTPENVDLLIAHLRERGVNTPWALTSTLHSGRYDDEGSMVEEPNTERFDRWVENWPDARMYMVFASVGDRFAGAQMGTERFDRQVGQWASFWTEYMRPLGLEPEQLGVLLVDEPRNVEHYEITTAWARAIKAAAPEMIVWQDPFKISETEVMLESFEYTDIFCPMWRHYIADEEWREMMHEQQERGGELWLYSCSGPARTFGPYEYYLAQAWHAFAIGAVGSHYWAFADTGNVSGWNDFTLSRAGSYSPLFLDETSVTAGKPMEAIRESQQDFEYLMMLRDRVEELAAAGVADAELAAARRLLEEGPMRVVGDDPGEFGWDSERDRSVQDTVRIEVLRMLVELEGR